MAKRPNDQPEIIFSMMRVSKYYNNKPVIKDISLSYFLGAKIGVLGLNGSGKSTVLRIMAGVDQDFNGEAVLSKGYTTGLLEQEPKLDESKTVRQVVEEGAATKVALLQEGMEFKPLSMTNEDAQLIDARQYGVRDIARLYGIPAHMLGDLDRATHSNIEQQSLEFVIYTLMPWIRRHEEAMERDFLIPEERLAGVTIQFNVSGLLRGDITARYAAYAQARQWGWLSINDIRRLENMPPVTGGDGYLQPLNMTSAGAPPPNGGKVAKPKVSTRQIADIEGMLR